MTPKRVYVLNGHPAESSLNRTLAEAYAASARQAGHEVRLTHLSDLEFDLDFEFGGYDNFKPLEAELQQVLDDLEWSEHLVLTTPMWWGGLPAKLKGLFDRALIPGRTFDTRTTNWMGMPTPMLSGRTGRVIMTSDTPNWFQRWIYGHAMLRQLRNQILGFVGIKPARFTHFSGASHPKPGMVESWIAQVERFGAVAA
ncbi:MAG: NAD(P)H-dependent oxidoreductase [Pseudomonadota bacterium]